jgi:hypothetical protein
MKRGMTVSVRRFGFDAAKCRRPNVQTSFDELWVKFDRFSYALGDVHCRLMVYAQELFELRHSNAFLNRSHQVDGQHPIAYLQMRIVKDRARCLTVLVVARDAVVQASVTCLRVITRKDRTHVWAVAAWATITIRPAKSAQEQPALSLGAEGPQERFEGVIIRHPLA